MLEDNVRICKHCMKPLKTIGTSRKNGNPRYHDWSKRQYHKKCWKNLVDYLYHVSLIKAIDIEIDKENDLKK